MAIHSIVVVTCYTKPYVSAGSKNSPKQFLSFETIEVPMPIYLVDVYIFPWKFDNFDPLVALKKKSGDQQSPSPHPLRTMNICTKFHGNPSSSCWDISAWTKSVGHTDDSPTLTSMEPACLAWLKIHFHANNTFAWHEILYSLLCEATLTRPKDCDLIQIQHFSHHVPFNPQYSATKLIWNPLLKWKNFTLSSRSQQSGHRSKPIGFQSEGVWACKIVTVPPWKELWVQIFCWISLCIIQQPTTAQQRCALPLLLCKSVTKRVAANPPGAKY